MKRVIKNPKLWVPLWGSLIFMLLLPTTCMLRHYSARRNISVWDDVQQRIVDGDQWSFNLLSADEVADALVEAIIFIESSGDPTQVGAAGERGLMQIMPGTWADMTRRKYGQPISFDRAFEPALNEAIGRYYLAYLQEFLHNHRNQWRSDERSLLLACYNGGMGRVSAAGFDVRRLPRSVQQYARRGAELHDELLAQRMRGQIADHQ